MRNHGNSAVSQQQYPRPVSAWRDRIQGSSTEGDEAKILRTRAPGKGSTFSGKWVGRERAEGASSMQFQDKMLKCIDCGADFVFTSGEQMFFHDKQFRNEPKRCKSCKTNREPKLVPSVRSAAKKPPFPSGRHRDDPCFAGIASNKGGLPCRRRYGRFKARNSRDIPA